MTENTDQEAMDSEESDEIELGRRRLLAASGLAAAGAAGYLSGRASAQSSPSGTFPASGSDPLLKIRADRIRLVPRSSDPSSPDDGELWYNDSA